MNADVWHRVQELYHAALQHPSHDRAAFLSQACGGDEQLLLEVESLLAHEGQADRLLESPAWDHVAPPGTQTENVLGQVISHYRITAKLGEGGMGVVWKAQDTELNRPVALKTLPAETAADASRRARFLNEARSASALNHPNIVTIHDIVHQDGATYIVMEFVDGKSLDQLIPKKGMRLNEVLKYSVRIADALAAAHKIGIVHRDLKPGNVMVTPSGAVKVLDFGLAKLVESVAISEDDPTGTLRGLTEKGSIVGTLNYMSPEQAEGKTVDTRSDIFSFGSVLYEMISGVRAFQKESRISTLSAVVNEEPSALSNAPRDLVKLLSRCLRKDPEQRVQHMGDVKLALEELKLELTSGELAAPNARVRHNNIWPLVLAAVVTVTALAISAVHFSEIKEQPRLFKMTVLPPEKAEYDDQFSIPAVSPDGLRLAFVATTEGKEQVWVRDLDSLAARALPGTEGAIYPFWSPDSRTIAFFAGGKLKKIEAAGGPALILCDVFTMRGGTWSNKGVIVWGGFGTGTFRVPAAGGNATVVTAPRKTSGAGDHRFPWFLPDGRHFLYTDTDSDVAESGVYVADLESKDRKRVLATASNAAYSPPGYLLFLRERTLMAQPFDAGKLQTTGDAVPIADQVDSQTTKAQNEFSISQNGVLAYTSGREGGGALLTWFDRSGKVTGTLGTPNAISWGAISPDGTTVAVQRIDQGLRDIWLHNLARGTASRFTFGKASNGYPVWSPDGRHIAFFSARDGIGHPFQRTTIGSGEDEVLSKPVGEPPTPTAVEDWSRDGRYLALRSVNPKTNFDIWVLPLNPDKPGDWKPFPYLQTEFGEWFGRISPDGRWLAYTSDESKRNEIYVQSFPTPGGKWPVSTNGGERSIWSRDGKELYFVSPDGRMMAAEVKSGSKFETGVPKSLFKVRLERGIASWFDVSKDGRFLIPVQVEQTGKAPITVVVNWQAGLKK